MKKYLVVKEGTLNGFDVPDEYMDDGRSRQRCGSFMDLSREAWNLKKPGSK